MDAMDDDWNDQGMVTPEESDDEVVNEDDVDNEDNEDPNQGSVDQEQATISTPSTPSGSDIQILTEDERRRKVALVGAILASMYMRVMIEYAAPLYDKTPYHTSRLTGQGWVRELLDGHPERIRCKLGVHKHVFHHLVATLRRRSGLTDSRHVTLQEQLAIFLYTCVTGLSTRHVGERFQRSNDTICKYFLQILVAFSSAPFYTHYVSLPQTTDPISLTIWGNPKLYPFFKDVIGAMDGTHINCAPTAAERHAARNRKGGVTQNCLAACDFDLHFLYIYSGWEGSAADAAMYHDARLTDLRIPAGKFYLADAGFPACAALLVPYRGVHYHLAEWGRADLQPSNPQELFNLRHASARNVVEHVFGVLQKRFKILVHPPEYDLDVQVRIPPALAAVHNFIRKHDPEEITEFQDEMDPQPGLDVRELALGPPRAPECEAANARRDEIARDMWAHYQGVLQDKERDNG